MSLQPPSSHFSTLTLSVVDIEPSKLVRISRHDTGEPYFGKRGQNRFDDPRQQLPEDNRYGASYFGFTLACAFAETVLHDRTALYGGFKIPSTELDRWVLRFKGKALTVAVLTGTYLKRLGGEGSLSSIVPYDLPQAWSLAMYEHPAAVDGFVYMSRHMNTEQALVLFDRASHKLKVAGKPKKFKKCGEYLNVLNDFGVTEY